MACCGGEPKPDIGRVSEMADRLEHIASNGGSLDLVEGLKRVVDAMVRWEATGFKTCDTNEYYRRYAICLQCPLWDDTARLGFGKCKHPKCGCTKAKLWLASEACPDGKW